MMNSYVLIDLAFVSCYLYFLIASFLQDSSKFGFFFFPQVTYRSALYLNRNNQ